MIESFGFLSLLVESLSLSCIEGGGCPAGVLAADDGRMFYTPKLTQWAWE